MDKLFYDAVLENLRTPPNTLPRMPDNSEFISHYVGILIELIDILGDLNDEDRERTYIYQGITVTMNQLLSIKNFKEAYFGPSQIVLPLNCTYRRDLSNQGNNTYYVTEVTFPNYYQPFLFRCRSY